jgi:hypothetical protein
VVARSRNPLHCPSGHGGRRSAAAPPSRDFGRAGCREIDRRLPRVVHEVRQQGPRGQRDHLDDVGVGPPGVFHCRELGIGHLATRLGEGLRERRRGLSLRVARTALPVQRNLLRGIFARFVEIDVNETLIDFESIAPLFERMLGHKHALREWLGHLIMYSMTITLSDCTKTIGTLATDYSA